MPERSDDQTPNRAAGLDTAAVGEPFSTEPEGDLVDYFLRRAADADRSPKVLIGRDGMVQWASEDAERILRPPLPLWIEDGKVHAASGSAEESWQAFLEDLGPDGARLLLSDEDAKTWVLVRGWAERAGDMGAVFLKCTPSLPLQTVSGSGLAQDFGLTRTECAVLDQFATLAKPERIAERLDVAPSTVRSHLKKIHAKMQVNSGTQLLRITCAYCDS